MNPEDEPKAYALAQKAMALKSNATPRERAYIEAVAVRYTGRPEDRKAADRAFADAMRKVVDAYPDDLDAAAIFAEALMDLRPWNYWSRDSKPYPETEEIIPVLQSVLTRNPNHPGAVHYWIHLWEPTHTPEKAEAEADRLLTLVPGAGHLVHMPGHIYARVGRYADVVKANQMAIAAVLLEAGRPGEAEVVYWEDLKGNRENGWSLFGLARSLRDQGKTDEAANVEKRFHRAWADADVQLVSSRSTAGN